MSDKEDMIMLIVNNINNIPPPSGDVVRPIIFEITTTEPNSVFIFPVYGPHNVFIDWGDGNIEKYQQMELMQLQIKCTHILTQVYIESP